MKHIQSLLLLAAVAFTTAGIAAQSPAPVTLIKAGHLLDPRTGNVLTPAAVLISSNYEQHRGNVGLAEPLGYDKNQVSSPTSSPSPAIPSPTSPNSNGFGSL